MHNRKERLVQPTITFIARRQSIKFWPFGVMACSSTCTTDRSSMMTSFETVAGAKRIKKRLLIPKLLFWPLLAFALVSQSVYVEGGFWDTTLEVLSFIVLLVAS